MSFPNLAIGQRHWRMGCVLPGFVRQLRRRGSDIPTSRAATNTPPLDWGGHTHPALDWIFGDNVDTIKLSRNLAKHLRIKLHSYNTERRCPNASVAHFVRASMNGYSPPKKLKRQRGPCSMGGRCSTVCDECALTQTATKDSGRIVQYTARPAGIVRQLAVNGHFDMIVGAGSIEPWPMQPGQTEFSQYNSMYYVKASGESLPRYDKMVPLPFGEYIPLSGFSHSSESGSAVLKFPSWNRSTCIYRYRCAHRCAHLL